MKTPTTPFLLRAASLLTAAFTFSGIAGAVADEVKIAPHTFTVPAGFVLEQVAAPPLVKRPIHMGFDERGALYVTDSSGNTDKAPVQLKDPRHRVLRLVDHDSDGFFDESTVFAEGLPFPEGILVHDGAVYVGAPPHIWKLRDTDGDHVADERTSWFDGGSIEGCGNDLHGPYRGPDGFFYWCKGAFAPQSHELDDGRTFKSRAAHVYRARPDGSQLEVVITGGMNNPVGLAFGEAGERFLSGTFFDLSQPGRRDGVLHAVYGGVYGRKNNRVLAPHPRTGDLLPILTQMGPAAPSGIVMPRSDALGLKGDLLCADFNLRRVSRHELTRNGSSHAARTSALLEGDQSDFHPTDVIEDADGSVLVADTGSWYMICCPTSKTPKPQILGALYRLRKADSPKPADPRGVQLDWNRPAVEWLADDRRAVVDRAVDALAKKEHIAKLRNVRNARARVPALWALNRIPGEAAREAVREFLGDADPQATTAAIHSIALWRDRAALNPLIELLTAQDPQHRRLAAMALGRIGDRRAVPSLLATAAGEMDAFLRHAVTYALYEIGGPLPPNHPVGDQVRRMREVERRNPSPHVMPEIRLAKPVESDPQQQAKQAARLRELAALLPQADPKRGQALFQQTDKSLCLTCHEMGDQGRKFGPDLTGIGSIRTATDLLEAVVFPHSTIARYYETVTVQRKQGDEVLGLIARDTPDKIVLSPGPGAELPVPIKDIKSAAYSNFSLMPPTFDGILQPGEIADLVAYLKTETLHNNPAANRAQTANPEAIPAHRPVNVPGLHAYAQKSIAAGEKIEFRVSSGVPYQLSVVRLGPDPENRDHDPVIHSLRAATPKTQAIHPGSYVHVDRSLPADRRLPQLTLECWIRPFRLSGWQGLVNQHDYPERCGIGLFLSDGRIAFITGNGGAHRAASLHQSQPGLIKAQRWHHVAATWDGKVKRIFIDGKPAGEFPFTGSVRPGRTALRLGAYASKGIAGNFYDGDLAMVAVHDRALGVKQIRQRVADRGLSIPQGNSLLACWPFTEERGTRVADAGTDARHGRIINRGTWMIGGPSFDASAVGRHDSDYDPTRDPRRGHGLRLASDELYNARWQVNHRVRIPEDAKSGAHAGRFDFEINGEPRRYFVTFNVRRPASRPKAPLLVLMSSSTWLAYNSAPFPVNHAPGKVKMGTGGLRSSHPDAATYSCYRDHRHGQPTYKIGLQLPWPAAGPNKTYINESYSHLLRGERFLHLWLDRLGYEYDVITDHDLDRDPEVLRGYEAVFINGHSEYWSARAYDGLDRYLKAGGDAVVLSGNTMFWRVSFDETGEVMECRKFGKGIGGRKAAQIGELYHSHDFKRGSLMRFCGYPAWKMIGLTCIGWGGAFKPYQIDLPDHFLFHRPHRIGLQRGESFGMINDTQGAVGHEFDVRLSTLQRATADPAIKGLVEPRGIVTIASSHDERRVLDFNAEGHKPRAGDETTIAEIIYWERPAGGRVFHTGSIATAWGMYHDQPLGLLVQNVLHHFGVRRAE